MSVLHDTARARLILGDARDELRAVATETAALVLVDPPYGREWQSRRRAEAFAILDEDGAGDRAGVAAILAECVRVVGQNRHLYVFGPGDVLADLKVSAPVALIWDKGLKGAGDLASPWGPAHEPIWFAVSKHRHAGEAGGPALPARLRKGTVIKATRPTGRKVRHPTEKPVALLAELIESSSRAGELVLDPCAGSGSTGVAAILRGRRVLLIESDPRHARLAAERLRNAERVADQMAAL